jgi:hypothetical protein
MLERRITWDGFHNARDLGGLPTRDGRVTRWGQLIRSAQPRWTSGDGWRAAYAAGVRTVLDLRSDPEVLDEVVISGDGLYRLRVALDPWDDNEFWSTMTRERRHGTPRYFAPFLARKPHRVAAVVTAIARAEPGGVLFHCAAGRDRTGVLTAVLLALAGVAPQVIADDYDLSHAPVRVMYELLGRDLAFLDEVAQAMRDHGVSTQDVITELLMDFDADRYLLAAGVTPSDLDAVRARLVP